MDAETRGAFDALYALWIGNMGMAMVLAGRLAERGLLSPQDCDDIARIATAHFDAAATNDEGRALLERQRAQIDALFGPELAKLNVLARDRWKE